MPRGGAHHHAPVRESDSSFRKRIRPFRQVKVVLAATVRSVENFAGGHETCRFPDAGLAVAAALLARGRRDLDRVARRAGVKTLGPRRERGPCLQKTGVDELKRASGRHANRRRPIAGLGQRNLPLYQVSGNPHHAVAAHNGI